MITINPHFLSQLLIPITGMADVDEEVEKYRELDIADKEQYRAIIRRIIPASFYSLTIENQEKVKLALNYYLSTSEIDFERVFHSCLPPFDHPTNAKDFFVWIWEELFGDERFQISDKEQYFINPDIEEPYSIS
ncbi:hypothetical protein [Paenibacillus endoradicis]|uniref:hypothetical protein n=1 Tax=Paenibacillus endoradicis TaxID=2972487 RepID=UPI0021592E71|nr:hypothetical protein [Paenibacillus endoradicis]MCR8659459.1 hypothetical protein [Paenibacillus endoradicis]